MANEDKKITGKEIFVALLTFFIIVLFMGIYDRIIRKYANKETKQHKTLDLYTKI